MEEIIAIRYYKIRVLANRIIDRLHEEAVNLGFSDKDIDLKRPVEASYRLERDPSSSEYNLIGDWQDVRGAKLGQLQFFADGSFVVEQDILCPHPTCQGRFVKALKAWGSEGRIEVEARLFTDTQGQSETAA
ncbi:MAG: hypothetical protein PVI97_15005 [Candidatus Thiodiazotropha sp.]|jgi:hypothetical protein